MLNPCNKKLVPMKINGILKGTINQILVTKMPIAIVPNTPANEILATVNKP